MTRLPPASTRSGRHAPRPPRVAPALLAVVLAASARSAQSPEASDWGYYGGDMFGQRFSSLDQINRGNVAHLTVAWTYRTGELGAGFARARQAHLRSDARCWPSACSISRPRTNIVIALDPETGHASAGASIRTSIARATTPRRAHAV